jgi:hypothetical protein
MQFKKSSIYIPMSIYVFFVILSTLLSKYKQVSVSGILGRYEGMIVLVAYMTILFVSINIIDNEEQIKIIIYALMVSAVIIGVIGIFQYFGHDIFKTNIGHSLMLPSMYESYAKELSFKAEANSNEKIKDTTGNKSVQSAKSSDIQMQSLSDEMDKLDSIMNGLDDSADISDTEEIINNLE